MRVPPTDWVPDWARRAVFYHIYPLGFLNASHRNDGTGDPVPRLADLRRWYDHIAGLGVTAIYFGPIFESRSHGYNTVDYFRVDRRLGDNALFGEILRELHGRGIRVILDGVFNHTGRGFFAFQDLIEKKRDSAYRDWYHVNWGADSRHHDGFAYQSWEGHEDLPKLNHANPDVRNYVFEVSRMWLGDVGVDGWRLDVAHEIEPDFWWEFRRESKKVRPDAFLVGELINGDYRTWVAPDLLDSGTDYQLYHALTRSFNHSNFHDLRATLDRAYHPEWGLYADLSLLTFLGNHDVTRILSELAEPRHVYPALILLMTLPGIPCLYYGDEVGMRGHKHNGDGDLRPPMLTPDAEWPDRERALYREIGRLAAIHKANPALLYGRYATLDATSSTFAFLRQHVRETVIVAINASPKARSVTLAVAHEGIRDGTAFYDVLNSGQGGFSVQAGKLDIPEVHPGWGRVLVAAEG